MRTTTLLPVGVVCCVLSGCGPSATRPNVASPVRTAATPNAPSAVDNKPAPPAAAAQKAPSGDQDIESGGLKIVVDKSGSGKTQFIDARDLLDRGNAALAAGDTARAIGLFDQLVADFAASDLVGAAMFNAGIAFERRGDLDGALVRYRALGSSGAGRDAIDGQLRAAAIASELSQWQTARTLLTALVARTDISDSDRVEAWARLGYARLESKLDGKALVALDKAVAVATAATDPLPTDDFIAMAKFYRGEIPRRRFATLPIRLPGSQMGKDIEAKADLLLEAEEKYAETIQLKNIYWATASGYRLASAYHEFWEQLVTAPIPPNLTAEARQVYVREVHGQVIGFLRKALAIHTTNLRVAEVSKFDTEWSRASEREIKWLTAAVARERNGELVSPSGRPKALDLRPGGSRGRFLEYTPGRFDL